MTDDDFAYQYQRWSRNDLLAEVRRLRAELQGLVAEASWDELAAELTEVEADNARLRDAILSHMDASYDPSLVADMALWAHIMDQDEKDGA